MKLCGEGFMIANQKNDDGSWDWRTFGSGEGFSADLMVAGFLSADRTQSHSITANHLAADVGQSLDLSSNTSIRLSVQEAVDVAAADMRADIDSIQSAVDDASSTVGDLEERVSEAELRITPNAIVSTVTGSEQYKEDLAAITVTGSGPEFVVGTQTSYTAAWTGNAGFAALHDGQQITYWLPVTSGSNVTLDLTLADGSATGAIPCYFGGTTRLGTQYAAGNVVRLTYRENVSAPPPSPKAGGRTRTTTPIPTTASVSEPPLRRSPLLPPRDSPWRTRTAALRWRRASPLM